MAFEWAWTKKEITKNLDKENQNMGDKKNQSTGKTVAIKNFFKENNGILCEKVQ